MHRFYAPDLAGDRPFELPKDEAHHLSRVLRLTVGDTIAVFDGNGREGIARVESIRSRTVTVQMLEARRPAPEPAVAVTLAQALLKSDKMDRVIRDAVMLGVSTIQPFASRRTDVPRGGVEVVRPSRALGPNDHFVCETVWSCCCAVTAGRQGL